MFRWQERAKSIRPVRKVPRFAHQYFDSAFPVWLKGDTAQVYYTKIQPTGEFQGSHLSAPKSHDRVRIEEIKLLINILIVTIS